MAEQAWFSAASVNGEFGAAAPPPPPPPTARAAYELRPLSTGELLDRTFYLYRSNFWLFVGLAAIAASVTTATNLGTVIYSHFTGVTAWNGTEVGSRAILQSGIFSLISIGSAVLYLAVYGVTQAATTSAVTSIYLGDATSMKQAFKAVLARWFRFTLIALWQIWSAMWLFMVLLIGGVSAIAFSARLMRGNSAATAAGGVLVGALAVGGFVYGVIAYIRNSFAVPAAVMEGLKVRKAMRRSKDLTSGTKGRIFLLFVFVMALYFVAAAIQSPLSFMILRKKTTEVFLIQAITLFVGFFTGSVIGPVGAIGLCLFYIDQRIRKEGFDIEFLIERSGPAPVPPPVVPPTPMPEMLTPQLAAEPILGSVVENP
jgi:hypothetical protein